MKRCRAILVWLLTLAALSCVFGAKTFPKLNSTDDLNPIPEHNILLLHLLANHVSIDNNNNVYPDPDFDPTTDYGSHYYRNKEDLLDLLPIGCRYYTIGNFMFNNNNNNRPNTCSSSKKVPSYVCKPKGLNTHNTNRARILLCLNQYNSRIQQTYLTQHYEWDRFTPRNTAYDPARTFEINPELLRELKQFSFSDDVAALQRLRDQYNQNIDNRQLDEIIRRWGREQAPLGLLMLLIKHFKRSNRSYGTAFSRSEWQTCELQQIYVDVVTGYNGYANVVWRNVPQHYIDEGALLLLINNQMKQERKVYIKLRSTEGSYATDVSLDEGLHLRLHKYESGWFYSTVKGEICRGKDFQSPHAVPIQNYNFAKLQLFVRNGYSCFRLYIDDCDEWKSRFPNSWVALYESDRDDTDNYYSKQWQWVKNFKQGSDSDEYKTFEYCTGTVVSPGLQARFMIEDYNENARTPGWPQ
ncbi:hypothetical protein NL108_006165 [Boleophthalmus pectinirostris]|uniref:uncharacterized protein LOC110153536 n=1 Tax=Boleophthalmus pectinirostris TaxID=150288 RepID=UPI00242FD9CB|nr:uncharacterized protein LOC110153536 [Boleophthalmus pectinirostris]KAJ0050804.1 hypothetical protein NL108_006165 [Boleophthalmus pectinirostris]